MACSGYRPEVLLKIIQLTASVSPLQRITWSKMSIVSRLRNSGINNTVFIVTGYTKISSGESSGKKWGANVNNWDIWKQFKVRYKESGSEPRSWRAMGASLPVLVVCGVWWLNKGVQKVQS